MINYSIIIPHKNIPYLLQRCIDSIPYRDDVQIIVIDDNSDPTIVDFSNFPGCNRPQVEIYFTKDGRGAGYARNVGLQHVKGKWVLFADADDLFTDDLGNILDKYLESDYEIIYFKIISIDSETGIPSSRGDVVNNVIKKAIVTGNLDILRYQRLEPWAKIMSYKLIKNNEIIFDETIAANDLMFSIKSASVAKNIFIDEAPLYCLTSRYGSLAHTISLKVCDAKYSVILNVNDYLYKIKKYHYRINIFYYIWYFRYFGIYLTVKKIIYAFKRMPFLYALYDMNYFFLYLLKHAFEKKNNTLIKIEK